MTPRRRADAPAEAAIEARAEALCNLWGQDPNNAPSWDEALATARAEWADGALRAYAFGMSAADEVRAALDLVLADDDGDLLAIAPALRDLRERRERGKHGAGGLDVAYLIGAVLHRAVADIAGTCVYESTDEGASWWCLTHGARPPRFSNPGTPCLNSE